MKRLYNRLLFTEYDGRQFEVNLSEPELADLPKDENVILKSFQTELPDLVLTKIKFIYNKD